MVVNNDVDMDLSPVIFTSDVSLPKEETNILQDSMEEEIAETESSLDEKEEESDTELVNSPYWLPQVEG